MSMETSAQPSQNHPVAALPPAEAARWLPLLESIDMPLGEGRVLFMSKLAS